MDRFLVTSIPARALLKLIFICTSISTFIIHYSLLVIGAIGVEGGPEGVAFGVEFKGVAQALLHSLWVVPLSSIIICLVIFSFSFLSLKIYGIKFSLNLVLYKENLNQRGQKLNRQPP